MRRSDRRLRTCSMASLEWEQDFDGCGRAVGGAVAELAGVVVAPAADTAGAAQGAGVGEAGDDGRRLGHPQYVLRVGRLAHGHRAAELAVHVAAPAPDVAV